jgi:hypothetical protein
MTTPEPTPTPTPTNDLIAEFRELGKNLVEMLRTGWESEERKKLQQEIETGLHEMGDSIKKAGQDIAASPMAQDLKADIRDLRQRAESGELEKKVRTEVVTVLQAANEEIKKVLAKRPAPPSDTPQNQNPQ